MLNSLYWLEGKLIRISKTVFYNDLEMYLYEFFGKDKIDIEYVEHKHVLDSKIRKAFSEGFSNIDELLAFFKYMNYGRVIFQALTRYFPKLTERDLLKWSEENPGKLASHRKAQCPGNNRGMDTCGSYLNISDAEFERLKKRDSDPVDGKFHIVMYCDSCLRKRKIFLDDITYMWEVL